MTYLCHHCDGEAWGAALTAAGGSDAAPPAAAARAAAAAPPAEPGHRSSYSAPQTSSASVRHS